LNVYHRCRRIKLFPVNLVYKTDKAKALDAIIFTKEKSGILSFYEYGWYDDGSWYGYDRLALSSRINPTHS
jgi:hypothetical protein